MSFDLTGKTELITWALAFMRSSWYIKNPFLKAKINEVRNEIGVLLCLGCLIYFSRLSFMAVFSTARKESAYWDRF